MEPVKIHLNFHHDDRGNLVVLDAETVPFVIKRVFFVYGIPVTAMRAGHAHKECHQVLVCVSGCCRVLANKQEFWLSGPERALYVPPGNHIALDGWCEQTVLLVLCSHPYDEEDYVRQVQ